MKVLVREAILLMAGCAVLGCSRATKPAHQTISPRGVISFDTITASPGMNVDLKLRINLSAGIETPLDSLGGFEFLIGYDATVLHFIGADKLDSAISKWEYFSYRTAQDTTGLPNGLKTVRVVATRNLNNGVEPNPPQFQPQGAIAKLRFFVSGDPRDIGKSPEVGFCLRECRDNTLTPEPPDGRLYSPDTTFGGLLFKGGYDTTSCPRNGRLSPALEFRGGWIRIVRPPDDRDSVIIIGPWSHGIHNSGATDATR